MTVLGKKPPSHLRLVFELVLCAILGSVMFCSKIIMEAFPNIHLLGMLTMTLTIVFRGKALISIYIYVLLNGLYAGFNVWWIPYLYIWTILWGITMLLPRRMPNRLAGVVYPVICGLHGLAFGVLYAPAQALFFRLDFQGMLAWIAVGLPFDLLHAAGNFVAGLLILPMVKVLDRLLKRIPA